MSKISVTFDSNILETIVDPLKKINNSDARIIFNFISAKKIIPYISETYATHESIPKKVRGSFLKNYKAKIETQTLVKSDQITLNLSIGSDKNSPAVLSDYQKVLVPNLISLGFRFICLSRIGGFLCPELSDNWYLECDNIREKHNKGFELVRFFEKNHNSGKAFLMQLLQKHNLSKLDWNKLYELSSDTKIAQAIAEWADLDSIGAHYGYDIDYFCTLDMGRGAGQNSIFSESNKQILLNDFGVKIVSPTELVQLL